MGSFLQEGMRLGIIILAGIPLFWAVVPVKDLVWGDAGWFGGGFGRGVWQGGGWGSLVVLF